MQIKPTGSGQTSGASPERARETQAGAPAGADQRIAPKDGRTRSDSVEISGAARELLDANPPEETETPQLDADRARSVLDRLGEGYYERTDVREEVLRRLASALGLTSD